VGEREAWPPLVVTWAAAVLTYDGGTAGTVGAGVHVEPGVGRSGLVAVRVDTAAIEAWGFLPRGKLGVRSCIEGQLGGTLAYLARGDLLELRSVVRAGEVRVQAVVQPDPSVHATRRYSFEATLPVTATCTTNEPARTPGEPVSLAPQRRVALLDAPGGRELLRVDSGAWGFVVPRVAARDGHGHLLFGAGPYLAAWVVDGDYTEGAGALMGGTPAVPHALSAQQWPKGEPLRRVPDGVELRAVDGRVIARTRAPALARVRAVLGDAADVTLAAADDLVVHGRLPLRALGPPL